MTARLENLEISGNLTAGREMSEKSGKCREKHSHGKLFIPTSHLGLCHCLVTSLMHVYYTVKYDMDDTAWVGVPQSQRTVGEFHHDWMWVTLPSVFLKYFPQKPTG